MCNKKKEEEPLPDPSKGVMAALAALYKVKILPLELYLDYEFYDGPNLYDAEFHAKPSVLLIGQYSTGKTTLIRYLVGEDVPGARIGPEPTTDTFTFVMYDANPRIIPGTSLMAESNFPFKGNLRRDGARTIRTMWSKKCLVQLKILERSQSPKGIGRGLGG